MSTASADKDDATGKSGLNAAIIAPWPSILSSLLMIVAAIVSQIYQLRISATMKGLRQQYSMDSTSEEVLSDVEEAMHAQLTSSSVWMGLGWSSVLLALAMTTYHGLRRGYVHGCWRQRCTPRAFQTGPYLVVTVIFNVAMWLLVLGMCALLLLYFAALVPTGAGSYGVGVATQAAGRIVNATNYGVQVYEQELARSQQAMTEALATQPAEARALPWTAELDRAASQLLATSLAASRNTTCREGCADLGVYAVWLHLSSPCVCAVPLLQALGATLDGLYHQLAVVCFSLAAMAAAGVWLIMDGVGSYVHAKRDAGPWPPQQHSRQQALGSC